MVQKEIGGLVQIRLNRDTAEYDVNGFLQDIGQIMPPPAESNARALEEMHPDDIEKKFCDYASELYRKREEEIGTSDMRLMERLVMLKTIDDLWKEHLTLMDHLRQSVGLQAMRQIDPLVVYKKEGHALFDSLLANIQHGVVQIIYKVSITKQAVAAQKQPPRPAAPPGKKVGRNDPCPCGSGKKYKKCCGRN